MFLHVDKLVRFFHINEYVLIKRENPIYITYPPQSGHIPYWVDVLGI